MAVLLKRYLRRGAVVAVSLLVAAPALSYWIPGTQETETRLDLSDPYQATAIVTGVDMRSRPGGFAQTLNEVLVKASGEPRLERDPRITALGATAADYVTTFGYHDQMAGIPPHDDQGTYDRPYELTVHFDPSKIDDALARMGQTPWRGPRPMIVPLIAVEGPRGQYELSASETKAADQREAFLTAAVQYGFATRFPTATEFGASAISAGADPSLANTTEIVIKGTLTFDESVPGWAGSWHAIWNGREYSWQIHGVNFDAAFRDAIRGALRLASGHDAPT